MVGKYVRELARVNKGLARPDGELRLYTIDNEEPEKGFKPGKHDQTCILER